ncbi:MAG: hypothetical protein LBH43_14075 [Treponema sp.]|jgi:hypothetical protein|nr:hypothetical protein [Treponema sp.]
MPQNKNLTQICFSIRGYGKQNGVINARKKALTREASKRYQKAGKKEKADIPGELVKITGYNRKYILHVLANRGKTVIASLEGETVRFKASSCKRRKGGGRKPKYSGGFVTALRKIRAFFSYRCGKILSPFMRGQTGFLEQPFHLTEKDKELLLSASSSATDRVLKPDKKKLSLKGKSGTKLGKLLKKHIPVRTYYADVDKKPSFFEIDTVHHCGTSDSGECGL